jgi:signal transduction histidine kinase
VQLREAQDQLVQREKMAALGGLVAGVAHEINTPLGVAVTAITHAAERVQVLDAAMNAGTLTRGDMRAFLAEMQEAVGLALSNLERGARLVQSFKKVAVDQSSETPREAHLEDLVTDVAASLRPVTRSAGVTVEIDAPGRTRTRVDAGALVQMLTNLVQNACVHAFEGIESPRTVGIRLRTSGAGVELLVSDNGSGMDADTAARVFEPFFTTRRSSGGSGLGMHIVHTIVTQRFLGTVRLDSAPGHGTRWTLVLPFGSPALRRIEAG